MKRFLLIACAIACVPGVARAQLTQMKSGPEARYGIDLARGFFEGEGLSWYTSTILGRGLLPVGSSARLLVDVGLSLAGVDGGGTDGTFANPEVGVAFFDDENEARGHLTVVLPMGFSFGDDDVSTATGALVDVFRADRWLDEVVSINGGLTPSLAIGEATDLTTEVTAAVWIATGEGGETEFFTRYAGGIRHGTPTVRLNGGVQGLAALSADEFSLGASTVHRLVFAVDGTHGGPGFYLQVPIDEDLDGIDAVLGFTYTF